MLSASDVAEIEAAGTYIARERERRAATLAAATAAFERAQAAAARPTANGDATSSTLLHMPDDCIANVLAFVPFERRSRFVRLVCSRLEDLCAADTLWVQLCDQRGITGTVADADDVADALAEPLLYAPTLAGGPQLPYHVPLPVQLAALGWSFSRQCVHISPEIVEQSTREVLAPLQRALLTSRGATRETVDRLRCFKCGRPDPHYFCPTCGVVGCSRANGRCMIDHYVDRCRKDGKDPHGSYDRPMPCSVVVAIAQPPVAGWSVWCYACEHSFGLPRRGVSSTGPFPHRLASLFSIRDLFTSMTHAGLFMRQECPHLTDSLIDHAARLFGGANVQQRLSAAKECGSRDADRSTVCPSTELYACLHCGEVVCGVARGSHMHQHVLSAGHLVVLGLKSQAPYCFGCDRVLGFGGTVPDAAQATNLRRAMRAPLIASRLWSASAYGRQWDFADPCDTKREIDPTDSDLLRRVDADASPY